MVKEEHLMVYKCARTMDLHRSHVKQDDYYESLSNTCTGFKSSPGLPPSLSGLQTELGSARPGIFYKSLSDYAGYRCAGLGPTPVKAAESHPGQESYPLIPSVIITYSPDVWSACWNVISEGEKREMRYRQKKIGMIPQSFD